MSIRYGIDLMLQPSFTAKVHQTRRIVCEQFSSRVAERQMVRVALTPYFPCPDRRVRALEEQVEEIARQTAETKPYMLRRSAMTAVASPGAVIMTFQAPEPLAELQRRALEAAQDHFPRLELSRPFVPGIALLEYADLDETMLLDVTEFAEGVASGLDMTEMALPWRLLLTRYSSEAAGEDWSGGRWAADLSYRPLHSHRLYAEVRSVFELAGMVREGRRTRGGERRGIGRFFGGG